MDQGAAIAEDLSSRGAHLSSATLSHESIELSRPPFILYMTALPRQPVMQEAFMTHIETSRVNEMLGLQIGVIRQAAGRLRGDNLEELEQTLDDLDEAIKTLRGMLASLPHHA